MKHVWCAVSMISVAAAVVAAAAPTGAGPQGLSLEKIMADTDWIGPPVRDAYWSADGRAVYYSLKRVGSPIVDLHRIDAAGAKDEVIDAAAMSNADGPALYDRAGKRAAFLRHRDVFVRDLNSGRLTQITRSPQAKSGLRFSADGKLLSFRADNEWFVHDFTDGMTALAAIVKAEKDPNSPPADDLREMQLRTFSTLKKLHEEAEAERKHDEAMQKADSTRGVQPFY